MPSLNMPLKRLKVAILPLDLPCSGPITHSGEILTTGKSHGKKPICNKGDKMQCSSCRGMCVLNVCYRVLNNILYGWPVPYAEKILGECQHGFRKGWLTADNLFMLRYILEKFYEYNRGLRLLFIDIKQAYDQ